MKHAGGGGVGLTVTGLGLLAALSIWVQVSAALSDGQGAALGMLLVATGVVFAAARLITRRHSWAVPGAVTAAVASVLVAGDPSPNGSLSSYANATGAFCVLGVAAALMLALRCPFSAVRAAALLAGTGFGTVAVLGGSRAAAAGMVLVGLAWFARHGGRGVGAVILGGGALAVSALGATAIVGALPPGAPAIRLVDGTLTANRIVLWHDAVSMVRARPLAGVGPGRFADVSSTARNDPDLRWAHHEFLELAAETGVAGLALGIAVAGWIFVRLWHGAWDAGTAVAALAVAALLSHATVDYVLHFPAVMLAASALAAAGSPARAAQPHAAARDAASSPVERELADGECSHRAASRQHDPPL